MATTCYNGEEVLESVSKLRRENVTGSLQIRRSVTIKLRSRQWKAVVVNLRLEASPTQDPIHV